MVEKYNREKVNILRESTIRGDEVKKLERENGELKKELMRMKGIQAGLEEQLESVYKVMEMHGDGESGEY